MMYYRIVESLNDLLGDEGILRLPSYLLKTFVMDEGRENAIRVALDSISRGENILIAGRPGTGKTAVMFKVLVELSKSHNIGYILEGATQIGNEHVGRGIILFYDDITRMNEAALKSIVKNKVKWVIATARTEEMILVRRMYGIDLNENFGVVEIPPMSHEKIREMLNKYLNAEAIAVEDPEAIEVIVRKSEGLPVYVWQVIRELKIKGESLNMEFAKNIPQGMLDYVDDILWRLLGGRPERYEALLTLLIMTDFRKYMVHQDLYNYIYLIAKQKRLKTTLRLEDIITDTTIEDITRYLARDKGAYSFRLPHDSWADVLHGKSSGLMASEITKMNASYTKKKRLEIISEAAQRAWHETIRDVDDPFRRKAFEENIRINFGSDMLRRILKPIRIPKEVRREAYLGKPIRIPVKGGPALLLGGGSGILLGIVLLFMLSLSLMYPASAMYAETKFPAIIMTYIALLILMMGIGILRLGGLLGRGGSSKIVCLVFIIWSISILVAVFSGNIQGIIEERILENKPLIGVLCGIFLILMFRNTDYRVGYYGSILVFLGIINWLPLMELGLILIGKQMVDMA